MGMGNEVRILGEINQEYENTECSMGHKHKSCSPAPE